MRCASPSTMAVLPTPGSPISTGLFFVRRARICITRRISSSRPITGSSLPRRASSVRSRAYCSSARYVDSGFCDVTRWLPRIVAIACRMASWLAPCAHQQSGPRDRFPPRQIASRMCSVETYSSFRSLRFVERLLENFVGRLAQILLRDAGNFRQPLDLLFDFARQRAWATRPAFRAAAAPRRRPAPPAPRANAAARSAAGLSAPPISCAACSASWAFTVSLSNLSMVDSSHSLTRTQGQRIQTMGPPVRSVHSLY